MNTTQLECFMAVANYLNFSRAAGQLQITQPAVSHQISTLEDELGVKLFLRTSKSVRLTRAGMMYVHYAQELLKLSALSRARVQEFQESLSVRLGIGCRNFLELKLLTPLLERLHQSMPMLVPAVRLVPFASLDNLLEEEDVQVIFTFRDSAPPKADYREFFKCPVVCACSRAHLLAGKTVLTIKDLQNAGRMATCPRTVYPERFLQLQGHLMSGRRAEELFLCDQMEVVQTLVASGYAFAILPDIPGTHTEGLCYIPVEDTPEFSYGAAYLKSSLTPSLRKFLKLLDELLNEKKNEKKLEKP